MVQQLPAGDTDRVSQTKQEIIASIDVCMGGRAAEELIYGVENITTGASNDLEKATKLARAMVTNWGFSATNGLLVADDKSISQETKSIIDKEIKELLDSSYSRVKNLLKKNR